MDLWYLPIDSIAGAAHKFPVGALFKKGGHLVAIGAWTLDSGNGLMIYLLWLLRTVRLQFIKALILRALRLGH
jgi:hypothetical protein